MNQGGYNFTPDDHINKIFCIGCRQHIPVAVSNANRGLCPVCIAKIQGPVGQPAHPPQPGQPPQPAQPPVTAKPASACTSVAVAGIIIFCACGGFFNCIGGGDDNKRDSTQTGGLDAAVREAKAKDDAEKATALAAEEAVRGKRPEPSSWDGISDVANAYLKSTLRDYESLELVETSDVIPYGSDKWAQRVKYRARNGFGGMNLEEQVFIMRDGQVLDVLEY